MASFAGLENNALFKYKGAPDGIYKKIPPVFANCCTVAHNAELVSGTGPGSLLMPDHLDVEEVE